MARPRITVVGSNTQFVETVPGKSSGVAPIFVESDSSNSIYIVKGANEDLAPGDVDRARNLIADSQMVILQLEISLPTVYHTIDLCHQLSVPVLLNPAPADPALDLEKISTVTFFVPNESELMAMTGMPVEDIEQIDSAARVLHNRGVDTVIVTMGERGALLVSAGGTEHVAPVAVESVDSTGAGDAFVGALAVYHIETADIRTAIAAANRYAALSTTRLGTQKSFATRAEFEAAF